MCSSDLIVNTDAILIYSAGYKLNRELRLYESFYEDGLGILHKGVDARLAVEQDREASMYQRIMEEERAQEESEYQIKQMERTGKITFH